MVKAVSALGRSGLHDWLLQRISAVVLAAYFLFIAGFLVVKSPIDFVTWHSLFSCTAMKVFTLLALISFLVHAWIGLWIVTTDYLKALGLRLLVQVLVILFCLGTLLWGVSILWSFN